MLPITSIRIAQAQSLEPAMPPPVSPNAGSMANETGGPMANGPESNSTGFGQQSSLLILLDLDRMVAMLDLDRTSLLTILGLGKEPPPTNNTGFGQKAELPTNNTGFGQEHATY